MKVILPDSLFPAEFDQLCKKSIHDEIEKYLLSGHTSTGHSRKLVENDLFDGSIRYAIHDEDLNFWRESIATAAGLYVTVPNPVSIIGGLVIFLYRLRRKRVKITALQALILRHLKSSGATGMTLSELKKKIPILPGSKEQIEPALEGLKHSVSADGKETQFVRQSEGRIWALDV